MEIMFKKKVLGILCYDKICIRKLLINNIAEYSKIVLKQEVTLENFYIDFKLFNIL